MYRIWDLKNNCEVEKHFIINQDGVVCTPVARNINGFMEVANVPVINQENYVKECSIGVKDKNGVKLFVGDVLERRNDRQPKGSIGEHLFKEHGLVVETMVIKNVTDVIFKHSFNDNTTKYDMKINMFRIDSFEKLGTIHDEEYKHLLEEKKDEEKEAKEKMGITSI